MRRRMMHLVAFLLTGPTSHHHGMWRHPETENRFLEPDFYEHIARVLELGKFDALFFADVLSLSDFYKGNFDTVLGRGGQMALLDPVPLIAIAARSLGVATAADLADYFWIGITEARRQRRISASTTTWSAIAVTTAPTRYSRPVWRCGKAGRTVPW